MCDRKKRRILPHLNRDLLPNVALELAYVKEALAVSIP